MSYNTRRAGGFGPSNTASSVGQRRPPHGAPQQQGGNFGGPNVSNKPMGPNTGHHQQLQRPPAHQQEQQQPKPQTPVQRQQPAQQVTPQQQQQRPPQQTTPQPALQTMPQPTVQTTPQPPSQTTLQQPKAVLKSETLPASVVSDDANTNGNEVEGAGDGFIPRKKPFWMKPGAGRITKRELLRRRNERLRRTLRPKNALMVLNELIGGTAYNVSESTDLFDGTIFKCIVTVDGQEHVGLGKSKPAAKGAAAEAALRHLVLTRYKPGETTAADVTDPPQPAEGEEKMDISTEDTAAPGGISWSHVASYALHKLLSEWDEGSHLPEKLSLTNPAVSPAKPKVLEKKPAKKLPEGASTMNPIMLLNQMHPNAVYEDVSKTGNPPHVQFTVKCTIGEKAYHGTGSNKKNARKLCAFGACVNVLGIEYSQGFLDEQGVKFDDDGNVVFATPNPDATMQVA